MAAAAAQRALEVLGEEDPSVLAQADYLKEDEQDQQQQEQQQGDGVDMSREEEPASEEKAEAASEKAKEGQLFT